VLRETDPQTTIWELLLPEEAKRLPVDLAVLLGAGERHGAAAAWSYGLLGRRFRDPGTGEPVRNYSRPQRFDLPGGAGGGCTGPTSLTSTPSPATSVCPCGPISAWIRGWRPGRRPR
jgi:hypothetical protein